MRTAIISRALLLALPSLAATGCDTKLVRTWYNVPESQRRYAAPPGAATACGSAADRAARLCSREARIALWPTDVRCTDAEWEYMELCSPGAPYRQE